MEDLDVDTGFPCLQLDVLGQTERINRLYTQITLCFPIRTGRPSLRTDIIDTLERGLARLRKKFPWVTGKVIESGDGFKIVPAETYLGLVVKELQGDTAVLTWDEFRQANFPFSMLDEDVIAPCKTMVEPDSPRPVFLIQANFVKGGLLLTFNAQHGSMDMAGQGQVTALFAKACCGEDFTKEEFEIGNMQRKGRIPIPDDTTPGSPDPRNAAPGEVVRDVRATSHAEPGEARPSAPSDALVWTYLGFPAASLSSLKQLAGQALAGDVSFVSTDDVLSAFIWQSITRARSPRLDIQRSTLTTLTRNVDIRRHFGLPSSYPGLVNTATSHTYSVGDIINQETLGTVASGLRVALDPDSLRHSAVVQATAIARDKDAAAQRSAAALSNPSFDVRLSSWAKEKFYEMDFGPCLGQPEAVRRPRFIDGAREGLVYFLPRDRDGGVMVGLCLRKEDMGRLKMDEEVLQWSRWVG